MQSEKTTIKSEAVFSDDGKHRFLLHKEWDKNKPKATIIMINPHSADTLNCDMTTMLVINNLNELGYGSVDIVNMYSRISLKLYFRFNSDSDLLDVENDEIILKSVEKTDKIIIAWGSIGNNSQRVKSRQKEILELLEPYQDKIYIIQGENNSVETGFHPLTPCIRNKWELEKINYMEMIGNDETEKYETDSEN